MYKSGHGRWLSAKEICLSFIVGCVLYLLNDTLVYLQLEFILSIEPNKNNETNKILKTEDIMAKKDACSYNSFLFYV